MSESMKGLKRTHTCGEVNENLLGQTVTVMGWVNKRRDLGKLIFVTLRDRSGLLQITVDGNKAEEALFAKAESLRGEYVIAATGVVAARTPENVNPTMKTGHVELEVRTLRILSEAEVPPFQVADEGVGNDLRLKYRYLDLRRTEQQQILITRHNTALTLRRFLHDEGFLEIETPYLTKSSPEGARDYLVPSRVSQGHFYALPQSPQLFKQILMVSGMDKYFQIVRCFRDEDLRADRQPEFTQVDLEMSFVDEDDVMTLGERMMEKVMRDVLGVEVQTPFPRMTYREAMERYGSDKPDVRFGMELVDITAMAGGSGFQVFDGAIAAGGSVRAINAKGCGSLPRKQIDSLVEFVKTYKAKGLAWISITDNGEPKTSLSKFFTPDKLREIIAALDGAAGDLLLICADVNTVVFDALGALRQEIAKRRQLTRPDDYRFLWVTEFPLFEWVEEDGRFYAKHHPFTSPMEEDIDLMEKDPGSARARAYDLVLNGYELGGGSIRIYQRELQQRMLKALGFSPEQAEAAFGFLLEAFKYGAPPHGGIALGLDRIIMLMTGSDSLRDVIAFPKVKDASCPMTDAPGTVDMSQLKELGIHIEMIQ